MNNLHAGFSRVNITPPLGVGMAGYFRKRQAAGVLDELEVNCLALSCNDTRVAMISVDHVGIIQDVVDALRQQISREAQLPADAIYIHSTHTHTGPFVEIETENPREQEYFKIFIRKVIDAVLLALADLKPAKMGFAVSRAPDVAFVRRFMMNDGTVATNPKLNDPNIVSPVGQADERVNVLRFDREEDTIILANFGNHPDSVGGNLISADFPGFVRRYTEQAIPGTKCLFFNAAQGDINHVKRFPQEWEMRKGYDYNNAKRIGRVITGGILQVYDSMHYVDVDRLIHEIKIVKAPSNKADPSQLPEAHRINDLYLAGKTDQIPYTGMMKTTVIAAARRMIRMADAPDFYELPVTCIAVGPVAFIGIPGEPFSGVGYMLKDTDDWAMVLPTCVTNGRRGYFPMMDAFEEGGYEAGNSNFKPGIAELLAEAGKSLLEKHKPEHIE